MMVVMMMMMMMNVMMVLKIVTFSGFTLISSIIAGGLLVGIISWNYRYKFNIDSHLKYKK